MSTHNIGFYEDLKKIIIRYHQIRTLFLLLAKSVDPDKEAYLGAVCSMSAPMAKNKKTLNHYSELKLCCKHYA